MFDWLFEGRVTVYVLLGGLALLSLVLYSRDRKARWAQVAGVFVALVVVYWLLDRLVETGREQGQRKVREMAAAVAGRAPERIFAHLSDRFQFEGMDKGAFRRYVEGVQQGRLVDRLEVWDFTDAADWSGQGPARLAFRAKLSGGMAPENAGFVVQSDFVRDPDGQWRLAGFQVFDPLVNATQPLQIPNLPR